jgi:hypothetical protein
MPFCMILRSGGDTREIRGNPPKSPKSVKAPPGFFHVFRFPMGCPTDLPLAAFPANAFFGEISAKSPQIPRNPLIRPREPHDFFRFSDPPRNSTRKSSYSILHENAFFAQRRAKNRISEGGLKSKSLPLGHPRKSVSGAPRRNSSAFHSRA